MITIDNLSVFYQQKPALLNVSLNFREGRATGIIGPNGAGKSTLMKSMLNLVNYDQGRILLDNKPLSGFKKKIAYVAQRSSIDLTFPITVFEVVLLGTYPSLPYFHSPKAQEKQRAAAALAAVEMSAFKDRQISELSGGQLQRIFIARALAQEADIYLMDEPFAGIDMSSEQVIIKILNELRAQGKTIIVVHHDLHKVSEYFDDAVLLNRTLIAYGDVKQVFSIQNITRTYGIEMDTILSANEEETR